MPKLSHVLQDSNFYYQILIDNLPWDLCWACRDGFVRIHLAANRKLKYTTKDIWFSY